MRAMLVTPSVRDAPPPPANLASPRVPVTQRYFLSLVLLTIACGIVRSSWATALDGFTIDEAYHIAAGASYLRFHDFRINPEHPPFVKLIAGAVATPSILHLSPPPHLEGKEQERRYTEAAVYVDSDWRLIQRRVRVAMFAFHAILFLILAVLLRRLFNPAIAIATLCVLLIDPTVAAHMPVVMTDLPLALLGTISVALAVLVLRDGRRTDAVGLGIFSGLLLASKHSAPLVVLPIIGGCVLYLIYGAAKRRPLTRTAALLAVSVLLASVVLWGLYGFRYSESGTSTQQFNRLLELKISDLQSHNYRAALTLLARFHLAPRPYIWGLADTIRAGLEGRAGEFHVFGHIYEGRAPHWVPLALVAIKIPLGIMGLAVAGGFFMLPGRLPAELRRPLLAFLVVGFFFLGFVCWKGIPYAGLRHLLFLVPIIALLSGIALERIWLGRSRLASALAAAALLAACVSALPQRRPWEYHNIIAGGTANAWKGFDNESLDLGQRSAELIAFYKLHVIPGPECHNGYWLSDGLIKNAGMPHSAIDYDKPVSSDVSGWFFLRSADVAPRQTYDLAALRDATPVARFGNLFIYHGTFYLPGWVAGGMYWRATELTYLDPPDPVKAERLLHRVMELEPHSYATPIELGNFALKRKEFPAAISWYRIALQNAPLQFQGAIAEQIAKLSSAGASSVPPFHNPAQE
jgi:hypothetical protein